MMLCLVVPGGTGIVTIIVPSSAHSSHLGVYVGKPCKMSAISSQIEHLQGLLAELCPTPKPVIKLLVVRCDSMTIIPFFLLLL